jgi:predicted dehydrogenase
VAAFKVSSPDIKSSWSRVDGHAERLRKDYGVKFYDSIEEMVRHVDAVLMEDNDARRHVAQAKVVLRAGKRLYIEKPMTLSARDAIELFAFARQHNAGVMSASGARFGQEMQAVRNGKIGRVQRAEMYSNVNLEPTNPELFWYGVHGVESLFTVLGPGLQTVTRRSSEPGKIVTEGRWADGRGGIFREGNRNLGRAVGDQGESTTVGRWDGYHPLVQAIITFFQTGVSPVPERETIEIMAFMEADILSKARGGQPVDIAEVIRQAGGGAPTK